MKYILILMVWASGSGQLSVAVSPHSFSNLESCKTFVQQLRLEQESKRIDASCIAMEDSK